MSDKKFVLKVKKTIHHVYASLLDQNNKFKQANVENCFKVGKDIGDKIKKLKVTSIRFDRNGHLYHGRIKSLADGARDAGLEF